MDTKPQTVTSAAIAPETSLKVRFTPVVGSKNAKAPKYRASIYLTGAMSGLVLEAPIFQDEKGSYSVSMPGGRFAALRPANEIVKVGDLDIETTNLDPIGSKKADSWEPRLKGALLKYLHSVETGKPQAEQTVNLT